MKRITCNLCGKLLQTDLKAFLEWREKQEQAKALEERPQGEWKLDTIGIYCSECKRPTEYSSNFCPNCGAKMKKGGAE